MNVKMRKVNDHNVEVGTVMCPRIAFTGKIIDMEKVKSKVGNKNRQSQTNKQVFDRYKEPDIKYIQRYDWWENSVPQAAARDGDNETDIFVTHCDLSDTDEKKWEGQ